MARTLKVVAHVKKKVYRYFKPSLGRWITVHRRKTTYTQTRPDLGKPGRGPRLIKVKPGRLSKYGYSTSLSARQRHAALRKAVKAYGKDTVFRMLHAQVILRKRTQPSVRRVFEQDRDWLVKTFGGPVPKAAIRAWKSMSPAERAKRMPGGS